MTSNPPSNGYSVEVAELEVLGQNGFRLDIPALKLGAGSCTAIIGRNGSGKSTMLDAVLNLLEPKSGTVRIDQQELRRLSVRHPMRRMIGAQVQMISWNWSIKVKEIMSLHRSLYAMTDQDVITALGVDELANMLYRKLSTGQRRRVDLAVALSHRPMLIVLDEPSAGLDRAYENAFRSIMAEAASRRSTILMATHDGDDLATADRVLLMEDGRIEADKPLQDLILERVGEYVGRIECSGNTMAQQIVSRLGKAVIRSTFDNGVLQVFGDKGLQHGFGTIMDGNEVSAFSLRPTAASDLLQTLDHREKVAIAA